MGIQYQNGNLFDSSAQAIVNTVNCVGVMGKGVALEFKRKWPENFKQYKKLCKDNKLSPGEVFIFDNGDMFSTEEQRYLVNFPTKQHWREKSKISYINDGLDDLVIQLEAFDIKSVAIPPLGCGNGGLPWNDVKQLIEAKLSKVTGIDFIVYLPAQLDTSPEFKEIPENMTLERAILVKTFGELEKFFGGHLTRISMQKIVYFLQTLNVPYNLTFSRNKHGPYSDVLKDAFYTMEKQAYIEGYSLEDPEVKVKQGAFAAAEEFLINQSTIDVDKLVTQLSMLIEGYESPYGMELLSTIHYLYEHEKLQSVEDIVKAVHNWNEHKHSEILTESIRLTFNRLKADGLLH